MSLHTQQNNTEAQDDTVVKPSFPRRIPAVDEIGVTSAPLKSAAFFLGQYCKEYNGTQMHCINFQC